MASKYWTPELVGELERDLEAAVRDEPHLEHVREKLASRDTMGKIAYLEMRDSLINLDVTSTVGGKTMVVSKFDQWTLDWEKRHGK